MPSSVVSFTSAHLMRRLVSTRAVSRSTIFMWRLLRGRARGPGENRNGQNGAWAQGGEGEGSGLVFGQLLQHELPKHGLHLRRHAGRRGSADEVPRPLI